MRGLLIVLIIGMLAGCNLFDECTKCGSGIFLKEYVSDSSGEHLKITCWRCKYSWNEPCMDHEETNIPPQEALEAFGPGYVCSTTGIMMNVQTGERWQWYEKAGWVKLGDLSGLKELYSTGS